MCQHAELWLPRLRFPGEAAAPGDRTGRQAPLVNRIRQAGKGLRTDQGGGWQEGRGGGLFLEESEGRKARKDLEVRFGVGPRCHTNGDFLK